MLKNYYTQLVEIVVYPSASALRKIQFVDQPYLRAAFIYGLETYTVNDMALSPQGNAVIDAATLKKSYLTLYTTDPLLGGKDTTNNAGAGSAQNIQQIPLSDLHYLQNSANDPFLRWPFELVGQAIIWEKSFIELGSGIGNGANVSFLFNVSFVLNPKNTTN